jgi:1,4-alpha-glucan branching enzyme
VSARRRKRHRWTQALAHALHGDPFRLLGPHDTSAGRVIRAMLPNARYAEVLRRHNRRVIGRLDHV